MASSPNVIYIVGPTASGKTALSVECAKAIGAEIVCADSQTVRRAMDIGTAKPTLSERGGVRHHMLDLIDPYDPYSVAEYAKEARACIADIHKRGKIAIVVGGTGLYIDALFYQFSFPESAVTLADTMSKLSIHELQNLIKINGYEMPLNLLNKRHLIRTLERTGRSGTQRAPKQTECIVGIVPGRDLLIQRINNRVEQMFNNNFIDEVKQIIKTYGEPTRDFDAIGYRLALRYIRNEISLEECKRLFKIADRQYAKRQMSWFKRNPYITWFNSGDEARRYILTTLC
jgi:tRNA dimethylallyltransferase